MATTIAHEQSLCTRSFDRLCEALGNGNSGYSSQLRISSILDEYGRFNVWSGNIGAHQVGRVSLDHRLRVADHVKEQVIRLLQYLRETLDDGNVDPNCISINSLSLTIYQASSIVDGSRLPYEDICSSSESDSSEEEMPPGTMTTDSKLPQDVNSLGTELQQLMHGVGKIIANLFKLSTMIRKGNVSHDRLLKSSKIDVSYYESYDIQHAKNRFPSANERLTDRMGKAISRRRQYLKYREQHHEKLAVPFTDSTASNLPAEDSEQVPNFESVPRSKTPTYQQSAGCATSIRNQASVIQSTNASTFIPSKVPEPVNLDVDVYSEADTQTSHATSVAGEDKLRVPPPPEASRDGRDFECPYCYTICRLNGKEEWQRRREWKRHVYKDLQPYMCTFDSCFKAEVMFEKRRDWFNHELQVHRREWCCNATNHEAYRDKADFIEHMKRAHADSYDHADLRNVVSLFERPSTTTTASCPFCISEETQELSISRLEKHIARHMEILALFSLPRSNDTYKVGSVQSGLYVEASHESEDESVANNGGGDPLERLPTASPTKGDSDSSELQPLSLFDNVLHSFCAVEAARDTSVPKYFLQGENKNKSLQLRKSNSELRWALVRKVDRLADGDIKIADFLMGLHTTCNTELENIPDSVENLRSTVNHFIYDIVGSIEGSIDYYLNSFESSDDRLQDTKYRVTQLRQDMGESLGEGQETGQTSISSNVNWDHVQPKVMIAASTITFFSRALATTQDLAQLVPAHGPSFDGLKGDLETLIRTLNGVTFDRSMADEVERKVWSQESAIAQYCLLTEVPTLSDEENTKVSFLRIPFVGTVMNVVRELLEILKAAPLDHQETVEEPGDLVGSDTRDSRNVVSWIRGQSPEQIIRHQTALAEWQPGTSRWFLDSSEYKNWTQRVTPRLNVLGNPDCGKTMLCAAVVEHLKVHVVSRTVGIAYYYWRNLADSHLRATDLLRSIISQFWLHSQSLHETPPTLQSLFALCNPSNPQPSREDLIAVFAAIVRLFDSCYMVIDGLEHCSDYSSFLEVVQGLESRVCTLVTSRRSARLGQLLADQPSFHPSIRSFIIDESHVAVDAEVVLRAKVALAKSPKVLMDEMTNIILQQAYGMFSWAVLQSERVLDCDSEYDAKSVLDNPPTQIYNSWHHSLVRTFGHHKDSAVFVKHFLEILSAATRPLSHSEFEYFYESHLNRSPHIDRNLVPVNFLKIETICSDFVAVVTRSEIAKSHTHESIKLVHPQLKNLLFSCYLGETKFWELGVSKTQANLHMAESCLTYLLSFNGTIDANDTIFADRYSLLRYAAQNWYIHATESDVLCLQTLLLGLFTSEVCFATWLSVHDPDAPDRSIPGADHPSPLYYACLLGFYDLAKTLLDQGARLDEVGGKHNYPLLAAVASGHREVVRMLLDEKDEANRRFKNGDTAMIRAASEGRADIVQLLLTHGGDPNAKDERHLTALHWAIRWEQYGIVPLLLDSEAEINAKDLDGRTALYHTLCVEKPNTYTFNLLIAKGVDVLQYDKFGKTMLNYAVTKKYLEGMQSLLAAGAQVDMGDHRGWTALHEATSILWFEGVDYLLSSCYADPDLQDKFGQTALHCALFLVSKKNHQDPYWDRMSADIIKRLLNSSADQSLPDSGGRTPLDIVRSCRSDGLGDVSKVLQSAQAQENLMPVVLYLKHKHLNMTFPVKLAAFDSEKGAFKIGLLRRRAAKMSGVSHAQMIKLFFNSGTFNRELCDDTKACKDEGLKHKSEVFYVVRKEDSMTSAVEETFNVSGNSIDEDRRLEAKQSGLRGTDMTLLDDLRDGHQADSDEKPNTLLHQDVSQGDEVHAKTPNSPGMSTDDGSANAFIEVDMEHEEERSLEFVHSHVETPTSFQEVHLRMEIFNSLSNSHHDTCEKVLPAALNKLDIDGDWREYALHIVYDGGEELCLSLSDKPWVIYYELAAGQHKPRLIVRRHGPRAAPSRDVGIWEQITSPLGVPRSYHCDHCPQSFNRLHDLKRHKKIHTGLKPFRCQYCDKTFTREAALKVHIKRCGRVASSSANSAEEGTDSHANAGSHEESPRPVVDDVSIESETAISGELHDDEQKEPSTQRQELLHQPVSRISGGDKSANTNNHLNRLLYMVTFKALRADLYCVLEATGLHVEKGDLVIVEADRGEDLGTIASDAVPLTEAKRTKEEFEQEHQKWLMLLSRQTQTHNITRPISNSQPQLSNNTVGVMSNASSQSNNAASYLLRPKMIKRLARSHETHTLKDKETREANAKRVCQEQAVVLGLNIEILEADFQMDRKKLTFYYFAQGPINLSSLIKDLFKIYATRIWMSAANPTTLAGGSSTNNNVEGRKGADPLPVISTPQPRPSDPGTVWSNSSLQDGAHPSSSTLLPEVSPPHGAGLSTPLSSYASFPKPSITSLKMLSKTS